MIAADDAFPNNVVSLIQARSGLLDSDLTVLRRPLRRTDPTQTLGVFASQWQPDEESYEMRGSPVGRSEPSLQVYLIALQAFVKDMDEERGLATHATFSKMVRAMLYRDEPLRVGLSSLSYSINGSSEHTKRWGIRAQRFVSNEIDAQWLYLSTLEFWLETETI